MPLPYENATSGKAALDDMQKTLRAFGAASFGCMENFEQGIVTVQFEWRQRRVTISASSKGYAAAWLRQHPYSHRMRISKIDHERRALKQANVSVYSVLRDWIKGQVTAVEVGMLSFEGAFLGALLLENGKTVLETIVETGVLRLEPPDRLDVFRPRDGIPTDD